MNGVWGDIVDRMGVVGAWEAVEKTGRSHRETAKKEQSRLDERDV